jgi:hypothetical protein
MQFAVNGSKRPFFPQGRGASFFEDELALSNLMTLLKAGALRSSFEERVLADTTAELDHRCDIGPFSLLALLLS